MTTLLYSGPFTLPNESTTIVKAVASHADRWWTESEISSAEYATSGIWTQYLDNTYWSAAKGVVWDGSKWIFPINGSDFTAIGAWYLGYRPTKMRITYDAAVVWGFRLSDQNSDYIVTDILAESGAEIAISFGDYDLFRLRIWYDGAQTINITNIEFYS